MKRAERPHRVRYGHLQPGANFQSLTIARRFASLSAFHPRNFCDDAPELTRL